MPISLKVDVEWQELLTLLSALADGAFCLYYLPVPQLCVDTWPV